jgi:hypothetical protein
MKIKQQPIYTITDESEITSIDGFQRQSESCFNPSSYLDEYDVKKEIPIDTIIDNYYDMIESKTKIRDRLCVCPHCGVHYRKPSMEGYSRVTTKPSATWTDERFFKYLRTNINKQRKECPCCNKEIDAN